MGVSLRPQMAHDALFACIIPLGVTTDNKGSTSSFGHVAYGDDPTITTPGVRITNWIPDVLQRNH